MSAFEVVEVRDDQAGRKLAQLYNAQRDQERMIAMRRGATVLATIVAAPLAAWNLLGRATRPETVRTIAAIWICLALGALCLVVAELRSRRRLESLVRRLSSPRPPS